MRMTRIITSLHTHCRILAAPAVGIALLLMLAVPSVAQVAPPLSEQDNDEERLISLNFLDSPLDQVLSFYSEITGRTMIKAPGVEAQITLRSQTRITEREALQAIESALAMHNVALVPMGDRFLRVVQPSAVRKEGLPILREDREQPFPESDQLLTLIINLQHMEIGEVAPILREMLHDYGKIQSLERTNSIMVTDTASNLNRILEVLDFVDQPIEIREDIHVRPIRHAEADQIASRLREFIDDREEVRERPAVRTPRDQDGERRAPPGVIRAPRSRESGETDATVVDAAVDLAERGVIQGRVKIIADDRINTLFIISRPVNFAFFDRLIDKLDQPVDPAIIVRVINLEYAVAVDIASILNDFIGAAAEDAPSRSLRDAEAGERTPAGREEALRDFAAGLARERTQERADGGTQIGRLSATTQILSDERSNALLLMGRRSDIAVLENIIAELDIMLGQVLIEAVIVEINLGDELDTGVGWLQRTLKAYNEQQAGPRGGVTFREPTAAFGGGFAPSDRIGDPGTVGGALESGSPPLPSGGLSYYLTLYDLNLDAVIRLAASSRDARILSTPVILTTDNTEAKIIVGESRPVVTSTSSSTVGDRTTSQYQYRDIGIDLTVTPRINPQRFVVMDINQSADNVAGSITIDGNEVPIITKREMQAQIAVRNRTTIALGGLVSTDRTVSTTKIPILGDIPLLGRLFRADRIQDARTELLVLITPYVLMTPEEARAESARLHQHSHSSDTEWHRGWSGSELARGVPEDLQLEEDEEFVPPESRDEPALPEDIPILEEGTYDRDEVLDVLEALQQQQQTHEPQEDEGGVIRWRDTTPVVEPEREADTEFEPQPESAPEQESELVPEPEPEDDPVSPQSEPLVSEPVLLPPGGIDMDAPVPVR